MSDYVVVAGLFVYFGLGVLMFFVLLQQLSVFRALLVALVWPFLSVLVGYLVLLLGSEAFKDDLYS